MFGISANTGLSHIEYPKPVLLTIAYGINFLFVQQTSPSLFVDP